MPDIFISHAKADKELAISIADGLEKVGYTTWYYERDSVPAESHLIQTSNAINNCGAVLLIISLESIQSIEVDREVDFVSRADKHIVPVLTGLNWSEFEKIEQQKDKPLLQKQAQKWRMILGSVVGIVISTDTIQQSLKSMRQGLESIGITPGITIDMHIVNEYPYPLASVYAGRLVSPIALQQAFQAHAGLQEVVLSLIQLLSAIVAGYYRKESSSTLNSDPEIESLFQKLQHPQLETWVVLLHTILSQYSDANEPLIQKLWSFFYVKNLKNDAAVSKAILAIRKWLGQPSGSFPPFSYQDFFELLLTYSLDDDGWLSQRAVLAQQEYQERSKILRAAIKQMIDNLAFMKEYTWLYAIDTGQDEIHLFEGLGENLKPVSSPKSVNQAYKHGHIYLFKSYPDEQPLLDLFPLLSAQQCTGCNQPRTFWIRPGQQTQADLYSYSCEHTLSISNEQKDIFHAFLDAADWERVSPPEKVVPLINLLYEMLQDGELTAEEQKQVDILGKALKITPADVTYWKKKICAEMMPQQKLEDSSAESLSFEQKAEIVETAHGEEKADAGIAAGAPDRMAAGRYIPVDEIQLASPPVLASFDREATLLCIACEDGSVSVYGAHARLLCREQFNSRPLRLTAHAKGFAAGGWDGNVSFLSSRQLEWQTELQGAVSALTELEDDLLAGTWNGQISRLSAASGKLIWTQRLDDGISSLHVSKDGKTIAAGTYAGQVAVLDGKGKVSWSRSTASGIAGFGFVGHGQDLLYASADGHLTRIRIGDQEVIWQEELPMIPKALTVAENGRRLYIFGEGRAQAFNLDKKLSTYGAVQIEEVRECMVLPFYADGHLILAAAKDGLFSFDESTKESKQEVSGELTYTAVSPNGRLICAAEIRKATLLHLAEPDVSVTAEPIGSLKRGKYTQLQVKIRNCGSQTAFRVSVKLTGAFTFQDITLPGELAAGAESVYNKQSIQPSEEGALPIRLIVEYEDEYGMSYSREDAQVLQVEPGAYK